jgi:dihydroflavonol-4-reductase
MPITDLDVETVSADVRDLTRMRTVLDGADSVFHLSAIIALAGNRLNLLTEINVKGSQNVARAALACGVQRYIHCSSIHAFDLKNQKAVIDETSARGRCAPRSL